MKTTENATGRNEFQLLRMDLPDATHAPGYIYTSEDVLQKEIDEYFMKDWLYAGRVEELKNPGDFVTMTLVGESIIVARDRDDQLYAYYNMCAHRGPEVASGSGNARAFKCPYHGWTYDLQGRLKGASHMEGTCGFDPSTCRLRPVRVDTWRGNFFVCFSAETGPLSEFVDEFEKDFGFLQLEKCKLGNKTVIELDCNWKLVHENLMDFYHVNVLHAKSFGTRFKWSNDNVVLKDNGGISIWYAGSPSTPGGEPLLGKMPWLEERDLSLACSGFMPPNCTLFGRIDNQKFFVTWPVSATKSRIVMYQLFSEEVFARPDKDEMLKIYEDFQIMILEEDRSMVESMQRALASRGFSPGRMSTLEKSIHHTVNGFVSRALGSDAS
jgi:phenylpropionate dioxygenase-like ring-hydroxylating dioxygenase large terminal subunit